MQSFSVLAVLILVAYTAATPVDHAHHAGPGKQSGNSGELIHWTTGSQAKGASTFNETKSASSTDQPATSVEPAEPASGVPSRLNSTSQQEPLPIAEDKETEVPGIQGSAAAPTPTVELESTTLAPPSKLVDFSKKH